MATRQTSKKRLANVKAGYPMKDPKTGKVTVSKKPPQTKRATKREQPGAAMRAHDAAAIQEQRRVEKELGITRGMGM